MKGIVGYGLLSFVLLAPQAFSLALAPQEFDASRKLACVLAKQSLGWLTEDQYGEMTHSLLDGFNEEERNSILAQAVGYYGGLTFAAEAAAKENQTNARLENFLESRACSGSFSQVMFEL